MKIYKSCFIKFCFYLLIFMLITPIAQAKALSENNLNFTIIAPGQPGSTKKAQPVMDLFANYIKDNLNLKNYDIKGIYFNNIDKALQHLTKNQVKWAIVSLGFYLQYANQFNFTPIAKTLPSGFNKDIWQLLVNKNASDDWHKLKGKVFGTMLYYNNISSCLLFNEKKEKLPFDLKATSRPLKSLKKTVKGKIAGIILDKSQYKSLKNLSYAKKLKIIYSSKKLPTSPVVLFGKENQITKKLFDILLKMKSDPKAKKLLELLQTQGFDKPDKDLKLLKDKISVCIK